MFMTNEKTPTGEEIPDASESEESIVEEPETGAEEKKEEIDYEALQKEEEERTKKPDSFRAEVAFKERTLKRQEKEVLEEEEEEGEKPLSRSEVQELLDSQRVQLQKEMQESRALEIARAKTSSEAEARAVLTYWKTRVIPSGNLEEDILFAIGGLKHKALASQNLELARALKSKENVSKENASTYREPPQTPEPKMNPADLQALKAVGYVWDPSLKVYKKPLGKSGKLMYCDPRNIKRTWVK